LGENHDRAYRSPDFLQRSTGREQLCATFFAESRMQFGGSNQHLQEIRVRFDTHCETALMNLHYVAVANVRPAHPEDDVFSHVSGVIGDPLQAARNK
jgi:hypothetical protein